MHNIVFDCVHKAFGTTGLRFFARRRVETYALRGLSLSIQPAEVLSLLGPNGSGKTTTLKLISTILLPDRGTVLVNGYDTRTQGQQVRQQVGFALASERSFFPRLTVRENLSFFATLENVFGRQCSARLDEVLHQVGLEAHANKQVMKLSSGMYQRLGIARAMIKKPQTLLLDEPSRSLDPAASNQLWITIRELAGTGVTIVLATHNFAEAVAVSDRIAVLQNGTLLGTCRATHSTVESLRDYYGELTEQECALEWHEGVPA